MLWGVFSDVHSNIEALDAVLSLLKERKVKGFVCCGDVVGYGPSPNEAIERLRALERLHIVSGNHDLAVMGKMELSWFNPYARAAAVWTRTVLTKESKAFLDGLPSRAKAKAFSIVHGSPRNPAEEYLLSAQQFLDNADQISVSPCFIGHSHLTYCCRMDPKDPLEVKQELLKDGQKVALGKGEKAVLNPGSVGQPRDRDPRASCGVYDDQKREFQILRADYDIPAVQAKMRAAGLPEFLWKRLARGQ